jgi:regulator of sigma E protease
MNYLFALLLIIIAFFSYGQTALVTYDVVENPVYAENTFQDKDVILKANGKNVYMVSDLMFAIENKKAGENVDFLVRRKGENVNIKVTLRKDAKFSSIEDIETLYDTVGISYTVEDGKTVNSGLYQTGVKFGFFDTIGRSVDYSFRLAGTVFTVLKQLINGTLGISSLGGTVTTIAVTADAIKIGGLRYLLNMASLIGVNLAVFNLLPIPSLDGSRVVFTAIEWVRKKPISRRIEGLVHTIGLALLLCFAIFIDLQRCF